MSQALVKTQSISYNLLRWVMRDKLSLEQLEEMDLLTIGFQLPPIVKLNITDGEVALNGTCVPNTHLLFGEVA